ncbi:diacylglycerol kinase family protein, partial [Streptomyces caniscabiei]|uniref:diacylglycerol kinase family protein n=1 Tax=Streptomyces caniscabiei TaxID=2746961 RepID=UPI00211AF342
MATDDQLLVVIDPLARRTDGEAVRIAKDVLSAGAASTKVCLPEGPEEFARALSRRGSRRPVVVGDDRALLRAVAHLHRRRELAACALSLVPVGSALGLAHSLGVPTGAVAAARAALDGVERRLDLLVDDSDGVVLGALRIPALPGVPPRQPPGAGGPAVGPFPPGPARGTAPGSDRDAATGTPGTASRTGTGSGSDAETGWEAGREADSGPGPGGVSGAEDASADGCASPPSGHHSWLRAWPQSLARTLSTRPAIPARISRPLRPSRIRVAAGGG